jgi:WD40 repeat protein
MEQINKANDKREIVKEIFRREDTRKKPLLPDPIMHLKYVLGYTASICPKVCFDVLSGTKKSVLFPSGTTQVKYDHEDIKQKFYFGHSKPITHFAFACDGQIMFTAQEGKNAIIRIWRTEHNRCIKMLTTPYEKIKAMSVSRDNRYLCTVGLESFNKELIILWEINDIDAIRVYIRQSSHFSINCITFSPFNFDVMVSCGRENIKFWRVKKEPKEPHLGGKAVVLNQYCRNNDFLCLDFENPLLNENKKGKVFIGSSQGCVYQVSCDSMELEAVYKIQDSGILSLSVNDAFCVTGSVDGYLRVWPIDFCEFLIEAKHDSGVCSVDIAFDALDIVCGTLNGSIGLLNIQSKQYKTILRSPPHKVLLMKAHPSGQYLFTIEDDNSVRVWNIETKIEAFQFVSSKDPPTCLAAPNKNIFACGFHSGLLKVFDLENITILYECKAFNLPITNLEFIQNDNYLISMNSQGHISIHDTYNSFIQIKSIRIDDPTPFTDLSMTVDREYFATIGPEANCVLIWNSKTFGLKNRIPISGVFVQKVSLITKNLLAVVLENCTVNFYSTGTYEGLLLKDMPGIHIDRINQFLITKNFKYLLSGGEEGMIKVWDAKMIYRNYQSYQQYIGHSSGIRGMICLENKSLVITSSDNSGIFFWNFLGDLTFCETEITQEFEKLGNLKELPKTGKKVNVPQRSTTMNTLKANHFEKTYKTETNNLAATEKRLKINMDRLEEAGSELNMLPVLADDKDVTLDFSQSIQSGFLNSNTNTSFDELAKKVLFTPKHIPGKFENM